jgi:hypothetical protein
MMAGPRLGVGVAALLLLAAGCAPRPAGDEFFPLAAGHEWRYRVTIEREEPLQPQRETLVLRTRGADTIGGAPAWRRRSQSGVDYWLRSDDSGIYRVASKSDIEAEPRLDGTPRYVLRRPYAVGTRWQASTTPYVLRRRNEFPQTQYQRNVTLTMDYRIEALDERVQTPAGRFDGCLRVEGRAGLRIFVDALGAYRDSPIITVEWYCPDVGLVRLERREPSASKLLNGGALTMELVAWR